MSIFNNLSSAAKMAIILFLIGLVASIIIISIPPPRANPPMVEVDIDIVEVPEGHTLANIPHNSDLLTESSFPTIEAAQQWVLDEANSECIHSRKDDKFNITCYHPNENELGNYRGAALKNVLHSKATLPEIVISPNGTTEDVYKEEQKNAQYYIFISPKCIEHN